MAEVVASSVNWLVESIGVMFYIVPPYKLALGEGDKVPLFLLEQGIPMFFIMMALEWLIMNFRDAGTKGAKLPGYRLNDFVTCVISGSFQQVGSLLFEILGVGFETVFYQLAYDNMRIMTIDSKANVMLTFFCLMLGKDLGYYWAHRFFHEWHFMWVGHSVHHSGEDYNLACALRQGVMQTVVAWMFFLPLAICGFHPNAYAAHAQLNTLFQFYIHTELVGRLPLGLEYILNSPSSHRMHHRPPGNCNYAAVFIIWDRMFGTYVPEVDRLDVYGLAKQPDTFDVAALNVNHFKRMADIGGGGGGVSAVLANSFKRRVPADWTWDLRLLFTPIPPIRADLRKVKGPRSRDKWDGEVPMNWFWKLFLVAFFVPSLVSSVLLLLKSKQMHQLDAALCALLVFALFACVTRVADMRHGTSFNAVLCVGLLPAVFFVLFTEPIQSLLA